jgi:SAM-dependent methyltransferase
MTTDRIVLSRCGICGGGTLNHQFSSHGTSIARCADCGLMMRNPQPSDAELAAIYGDQYFLGSELTSGDAYEETFKVKRQTASAYLDEIEARLGIDRSRCRGLRLLELGPGLGCLLVEAAGRGYDVTGIEFSASAARSANNRLGSARVLQGDIKSVQLAEESFDVAVLADVIEHAREPLKDLQQIWRFLRPGGLLFIAVPSLDSWSARLMRERWMEFKTEHLFYFDRSTIRLLLLKSGFKRIHIATDWKTLTPEYIIHHFNRFRVPFASAAVRLAGSVMPQALRRLRLRVVASGINVLAAKC